METVELGSYEKCQDLRALLKRKHRFILLRSPGNKVGLSPMLADLPPGQGLLGKVTLEGSRNSLGPWIQACQVSVQCGGGSDPGSAVGGTFGLFWSWSPQPLIDRGVFRALLRAPLPFPLLGPGPRSQAVVGKKCLGGGPLAFSHCLDTGDQGLRQEG